VKHEVIQLSHFIVLAMNAQMHIHQALMIFNTIIIPGLSWVIGA
jgi:hypothetical protein